MLNPNEKIFAVTRSNGEPNVEHNLTEIEFISACIADYEQSDGWFLYDTTVYLGNEETEGASDYLVQLEDAARDCINKALPIDEVELVANGTVLKAATALEILTTYAVLKRSGAKPDILHKAKGEVREVFVVTDELKHAYMVLAMLLQAQF